MTDETESDKRLAVLRRELYCWDERRKKSRKHGGVIRMQDEHEGNRAANHGGVESEMKMDGQKDIGEVSDGFHTFAELYDHRLALSACLFNEWADTGMFGVQKSWNHSDGQPCFGGGWFIVVAQLPGGQISYHYEAKHWGLFTAREVKVPPEYDGHTPASVVGILKEFAKR